MSLKVIVEHSIIIYSPSCCSKPCMTFFILWDTKVDILKNLGNKTTLGNIDFYCIDKTALRPLCSTEDWILYSFGWIWVYFILGSIIPLRLILCLNKHHLSDIVGSMCSHSLCLLGQNGNCNCVSHF